MLPSAPGANRGALSPARLPCALLPGPGEEMRANLHAFLGALKAMTGYQQLEDTYMGGLYCLAVLQDSVAASSIAEEAGEFTITFNRKPQWYYTGDEALTLTEPGTVANPTLFTALPCINVYGAGAGTLTIGGVTVEILELEDVLTIDCELMDAYRQVGDAAAENKNSAISAAEFPTLEPGENIVSWTGDIESVEILPRWWTL